MNETLSKITVTHQFYIFVRYKKTNRHGTRIFIVTALAKEDKDYTYVGEFHVNKNDEVIYLPQPNMFCSFLSAEIEKLYSLSDLVKLVSK